ncbi:Glycolate oxidase subunit GlcD [Geodia barretti]|uniref:Glycolate oxidase subunit GlcD n=1 Tax=Geodia barretti TaxID=519541 RepID=A0AA35WHV4_GEOBA|nr:Glycolate oxidase subunit GlcD [Geodia barretti]
MTTPTVSTASAQLADLLGPDAVVAANQLRQYGIGTLTPVAAVRPIDRGGVASAMAWANRTNTAVYPSGGRTQIDLGNPATKPGIALDLTRLNHLVDFQPADLTITAEAGMTIEQLQSLPVPPSAAPLATGTSGPLRSTYGLPRDWLIGISVVDPRGVQTNAGGKVVKNVTGYDLNRLYTGSLGTLAVITEATFKIAPAPAEWSAIVGGFSGLDTTATACQNLQAQHFAPLGLHILNRSAAQRLAALGDIEPADYIAIAIIGGRPSSVQRRQKETVALWKDNAVLMRNLKGDETVALTAALTDLPANPDARPTISVRVNSQPAGLRDILGMELPVATALPPPGVVADVGFGGGRLLWWNDCSDTNAQAIAEALQGIHAAAVASGGSAVVERCPISVKRRLDVWGPLPSSMTVMRRLKAQFDPAGILNPGRFIGGL